MRIQRLFACGVSLFFLCTSSVTHATEVLNFTQSGTVSTATRWQLIADDFTGDGRADVLAYNPSTGALQVGTSNNGTFTFATWATVSPPDNWTFATGDFN